MNSLNLGIAIALKDQFSAVASKIEQAYQKLDNGLAVASNNIEKHLSKMKAGFAMVTAGVAILGSLSAPVKFATDFEYAMAEVSTLVDTSVVDMQRLREEVSTLAKLYNGDQIDQAKALYQTISAGVTDATEAVKLLHVANKMAIGGVTDVTTAIDGLTSVLNAYGKDVSYATELSDQFFTAIKLGKTTVPELAHSIGNVVGIASNLKVSTNELLGAVASLTLGGLDTRRAVTGLRQTLQSILAPAEQTKKIAKELGIEWSKEALQAKGLAGFMKELRKKVGDNGEAIRKLIPGIEGVNATLTLLGDNFDKFIEVMEEMENTAGATELAFRKMAETFKYNLDVAISSSKVLLTKIGNIIAPVFRFFTKVYIGFINFVTGLIDKFPLLSKVIIGTIGALGILLTTLGLFKMTMSLVGLAIPAFNFLLHSMGIQATITGSMIMAGLKRIFFPFLLIMGSLKLLKKAWDEDWGGIASTIKDTIDKVRLIRKGLNELITSTKDGVGELSKSTADALEQSGLLDTVITLYMWWYRLSSFIDGFKTGMVSVGETISSVVKSMAETLRVDGKFVLDILQKIGLLKPSDDTVEAYKSLGEVIGKVVGWMLLFLITIKTFGELSKIILKGAGFFRTIGKVIGWVVKGVGFLLKGLGAIIVAIANVVGLPAWAVGLIIAAIAGLVYVVIRYWDVIKEKTKEILSSIKDFVTEKISSLKITALNVKEWFVNAFNDIKEGVKIAFTTVHDFIVGIMDKVKETVGNIIGWIEEKISWVTDKAGGIIDKAKGIGSGIKEGITGFIKRGKEFIGLSTGGQLKENAQGLAYLHPNEVILNSPLVEKLERFFSAYNPFIPKVQFVGVPNFNPVRIENTKTYKDILVKERIEKVSHTEVRNDDLGNKLDRLIELMARFADRPIVFNGKVELDGYEVGKVVDRHNEIKQIRNYRASIR